MKPRDATMSHLRHEKIKRVRKKKERKVVRKKKKLARNSWMLGGGGGVHCCAKLCLNLVTANDAEKIYSKFSGTTRVERYAKVKEFLQNSKVPSYPSPPLGSHIIARQHFVLRLDLGNDHYYYPCPSAFKFLVHIGMTTLELLSDSNSAIGIIHQLAKTTKQNKSELCKDWFETYIKPLSTEDEYEPTYLRCDAYSSPKDVLVLYAEYLRDNYDPNDKLSFCSPSTFSQIVRQFFDMMLWGESGFCGECFTYDGYIRELRNEKKGDPNATADTEKWKLAKEKHKTRARALRNLSKQYWYEIMFAFFSPLLLLLFILCCINSITYFIARRRYIHLARILHLSSITCNTSASLNLDRL
jgi:hypothetical protein